MISRGEKRNPIDWLKLWNDLDKAKYYGLRGAGLTWQQNIFLKPLAILDYADRPNVVIVQKRPVLHKNTVKFYFDRFSEDPENYEKFFN